LSRRFDELPGLIEEKLAAQRAELDAWKSVTLSTDFVAFN